MKVTVDIQDPEIIELIKNIEIEGKEIGQETGKEEIILNFIMVGALEFSEFVREKEKNSSVFSDFKSLN